jgi:hypothetical protein
MTVRYTVILDEAAVDNMEWLRVTYGLKTKADVIDLARTVLTWMTEAQIQGYEVGRFKAETFQPLLLPYKIKRPATS